MPDVYDHLKVINNALGAIGAGQIMAEDEDTELAAQVVPVYYSRLRAMLGMHPYSFAAKTFKLDALAMTAANDYDTTDKIFNNGWRYAFALPGSRIGLPRTVLTDPRRPDAPLREFSIEGATLYADRDKVWIIATVMPDPAVWDPQFALAMERIAAADFAIPVTQDAKLDAAIRAIAEGTSEFQGRGGLVGRAIATDAARARTSKPLARDPLTDARLM